MSTILALNDTVRQLLRYLALSEKSLSETESRGLMSLIETGSISLISINEPLLLTADDAARFLGISTDSFARARKENPQELAPVEIYPGYRRWSKAQLITFTGQKVKCEPCTQPQTLSAPVTADFEFGRELSA